MTAMDALPTPKLTRPCEGSRWYSFYAMFSESFARGILERASLSANALVLDPWLGAGTTTSVASSLGFRACGFDINPAMVSIARGRLATRDVAIAAQRLIESTLSATKRSILSDDPLLTWFELDAARELRAWERSIAAIRATVAPEAADFLLTALFATVRHLAKSFKSKNPTWLKRPQIDSRIDATWQQVRSLLRQECGTRRQLAQAASPENDVRIEVGSSDALRLQDSSADFVLTSPPYCTRIDYAISTQLELAVLGVSDCSLRELRNRSMGTSTVRKTSDGVNNAWGATCTAALAQIARHRSKASKSYYLKTYVQYFRDLSSSLTELDRVLRPGGAACLVVQDSYYKSIQIDLAQIVIEMGQGLGWAQHDRMDFTATRNMRSINTRSRKYLSNVNAVESVLWLVKAKSDVRKQHGHAK
jgi:DNA modification methylase